MTDKNTRVCAYIDLKAIDKNFESMKQVLSPGTKMIAVVKSDAYFETMVLPNQF